MELEPLRLSGSHIGPGRERGLDELRRRARGKRNDSANHPAFMLNGVLLSAGISNYVWPRRWREAGTRRRRRCRLASITVTDGSVRSGQGLAH